jgi:hypothetical protein
MDHRMNEDIDHHGSEDNEEDTMALDRNIIGIQQKGTFLHERQSNEGYTVLMCMRRVPIWYLFARPLFTNTFLIVVVTAAIIHDHHCRCLNRSLQFRRLLLDSQRLLQLAPKPKQSTNTLAGRQL